jgi:hypothetical protein
MCFQVFTMVVIEIIVVFWVYPLGSKVLCWRFGGTWLHLQDEWMCYRWMLKWLGRRNVLVVYESWREFWPIRAVQGGNVCRAHTGHFHCYDWLKCSPAFLYDLLPSASTWPVFRHHEDGGTIFIQNVRTTLYCAV